MTKIAFGTPELLHAVLRDGDAAVRVSNSGKLNRTTHVYEVQKDEAVQGANLHKFILAYHLPSDSCQERSRHEFFHLENRCNH